jgi:HEPN domain-containing protein
VTNASLAQSYLTKARARLKTLPVLMGELAWSDVIRESQEIVELALKAMLRHVGVEPPHWHDVGGLVLEHRARFGTAVDADLDRLAATSAWLRKEREFAFYGDIDLIPTDQYREPEAIRARDEAAFVVAAAAKVIEPRSTAPAR